jgi:hypothetical protein
VKGLSVVVSRTVAHYATHAEEEPFMALLRAIDEATDAGRFAEASQKLEEAALQANRHDGPGGCWESRLRYARANLLSSEGRLEALTNELAAIAANRSIAPTNTLRMFAAAAHHARLVGLLERAEALAREGIERTVAIFGAATLDTADAMYELGHVLLAAHDVEGARKASATLGEWGVALGDVVVAYKAELDAFIAVASGSRDAVNALRTALAHIEALKDDKKFGWLGVPVLLEIARSEKDEAREDAAAGFLRRARELARLGLAHTDPRALAVDREIAALGKRSPYR